MSDISNKQFTLVQIPLKYINIYIYISYLRYHTLTRAFNVSLPVALINFCIIIKTSWTITNINNLFCNATNELITSSWMNIISITCKNLLVDC